MTVSDGSGAAAAASSGGEPADSAAAQQRERLSALLRRARYEVLPLAGAADEVADRVPTSLAVTVTSTPRRGLEPTLALSEEMIRRGYTAVPHLAARLFRDESQLADVLGRLDDAGVRDVFVVSGDGDRSAGGFSDSVQLVAAMARLRGTGTGSRIRDVGVAGYPEGHPRLSDAELDRALLAKQPTATYAVTQMCFDPAAVHRWIERSRRLGFTGAVHVGVPGTVDRLRLLRVAGRIGVGTSLRFIRRQHELSTLLTRSGYRPDDLLDGLAAHDDGRAPRVAGLHLYTLGDVTSTEHWRREILDRLDDGEQRG